MNPKMLSSAVSTEDDWHAVYLTLLQWRAVKISDQLAFRNDGSDISVRYEQRLPVELDKRRTPFRESIHLTSEREWDLLVTKKSS